jgi:prophage regulatory protein
MSAKEVTEFLRISRSTLWRLEQTDPTFPRKLVLTCRKVGWFLDDLEEWLESKQLA